MINEIKTTIQQFKEADGATKAGVMYLLVFGTAKVLQYFV